MAVAATSSSSASLQELQEYIDRNELSNTEVLSGYIAGRTIISGVYNSRDRLPAGAQRIAQGPIRRENQSEAAESQIAQPAERREGAQR